MINIKIPGQKLLNILGMIRMVNNTMTIWFRPDEMIIEAINPLKVAMVRIIVKKEDLPNYSSDEDTIIGMDITEVWEDLEKGISGYIHIKKENNGQITLKSPYYTTYYPIFKQNLKELNSYIVEPSQLQLPLEVIKLLRVLKTRGIDKLTISQNNNKFIFVGKGKKNIYTYEHMFSEKVKFGSTTVNSLWFYDIISSLEEGKNVDFNFTPLGNLYLNNCSYGYQINAILAGTVRKLGIPDDLPKIEIDENSTYEW